MIYVCGKVHRTIFQSQLGTNPNISLCEFRSSKNKVVSKKTKDFTEQWYVPKCEWTKEGCHNVHILYVLTDLVKMSECIKIKVFFLVREGLAPQDFSSGCENIEFE